MFKDIRNIRKKVGITQKQLALLLGVSQSYISKIERNLLEPKFSFAMKLMKVLNSHKGDIRDIMTNRIVYANENESIKSVIRKMKKHGISQMPVKRKNHIIGSITERAISECLISGRPCKKVKDVMEEPFPVIDVSAPVNLVSSILEYTQAVLITEKGKIRGIITRTDLLKLI